MRKQAAREAAAGDPDVIAAIQEVTGTFLLQFGLRSENVNIRRVNDSSERPTKILIFELSPNQDFVFHFASKFISTIYLI